MATITERNGRFFVRVRVKGYPTTSKTFTRRADATSWGRKVQADMEGGRWTAATRTVPTLASALEDYERAVASKMKGAATYAYRFAEFSSLPMAAKRIDEVTPADVARWRDQQLQDRLKPGTVVRKLAMLSAVFTWAMKERGWVAANPLAMITRPRVSDGRDRVLSTEEQHYLLRAAETSKAHWLAPALTVLMSSAMRRGELFSLKVGDVQIDRAVAHLSDTKNGTARDVPLCPASLAAMKGLAEMAGREPSAPLLPVGEAGSVSTRFLVTVRRARAAYERDCAAKGEEPTAGFLDDVRLHDLRHHAITKWASTGGLSTAELQAVSGHRSLRALSRYTHLSASALAGKLATLSQ